MFPAIWRQSSNVAMGYGWWNAQLWLDIILYVFICVDFSIQCITKQKNDFFHISWFIPEQAHATSVFMMDSEIAQMYKNVYCYICKPLCNFFVYCINRQKC